MEQTTEWEDIAIMYRGRLIEVRMAIPNYRKRGFPELRLFLDYCDVHDMYFPRRSYYRCGNCRVKEPPRPTPEEMIARAKQYVDEWKANYKGRIFDATAHSGEDTGSNSPPREWQDHQRYTALVCIKPMSEE